MGQNRNIFKQSSLLITKGDIMTQVSFRAQIDDYTNRVLGVIKEKHGLKNKSEALDMLADMFGEEFVEREVKDEVIKEVELAAKEHYKKYGYRRMTLKELDKLCGIDV